MSENTNSMGFPFDNDINSNGICNCCGEKKKLHVGICDDCWDEMEHANDPVGYGCGNDHDGDDMWWERKAEDVFGDGELNIITGNQAYEGCMPYDIEYDDDMPF